MKTSLSCLIHCFVLGLIVIPMLAVAPGYESAAAEAVTIKLDVEQGESFVQETKIDQVTMQSVNGQQMLSEMYLTFTSTTTVTNTQEDGTLTFESVFDRIEAEVSDPQGQGTYDSQKGGAVTHPVLVAMSTLKGRSISYDLTPEGKATNVKGFEGLADEVIAKLKLPAEAIAVVKPMLEKQMGNETMGQMIESGHASYPDKPVTVGDTWEQNQHVDGIVPIDLSLTYTLTAVGNSTAAASMTGEIATPEDAKMEIMPNVAMELKMSGTQTGEVVFERDNGWVKSMTTTQAMKGEMNMPSANMTIPMTIDTTVTVKTLPGE